MPRVPIGQIRSNKFQVRKYLDRAAVEALAAEIKELGYWGTLRARKQGAYYELVFGHRRLEALKLLKVKEVDLDVIDLSDDEMATQAVVENMQREGLTDTEKATGIKFLVDRFEASGIRQAAGYVGKLLGLSQERIYTFLRMDEFPAPTKRLIENKQITGAVAIEARSLGGDEMVRTAADKKLSQHTIQKIAQQLDAIKEPKIRAKVQKAVVAGKVLDADQVREREREVRRTDAARSGTKEPDDLHIVIRVWTKNIKEWTVKLDAVLPYLDYIEEDTEGAAQFKTASRELIEKLKGFL